MQKQRCMILIDGSNFYFKLKDLKLSNLLSFNFAGFAKALAKDSKITNGVYYIGKVKTNGSEKSNRMLANQQKLFSHLRKSNFNYSLGYLLRSDDKYHEKGVDVNIAVDVF